MITKLTAKWNNICAVQPKGTKPDDSKPAEKAEYLALMTALTTTVKGLSEQVKTIQKSNGSAAKGGANANSNASNDIAAWRKSKDFGDEIFKDNKQYYWCPQHQNGAGLYVTHHPLDHGKRPKDWEHTKRRSGTKPPPSTQTQPTNETKLQLAESMKAALMTNGLTDDAAAALMQSIKDDSGTDFW